MRGVLHHFFACLLGLALSIATVVDNAAHAAHPEAGPAPGVQHPDPAPDLDDCHALPGGGCQITGVTPPIAPAAPRPNLVDEYGAGTWRKLKDLLRLAPQPPPPNAV